MQERICDRFKSGKVEGVIDCESKGSDCDHSVMR